MQQFNPCETNFILKHHSIIIKQGLLTRHNFSSSPLKILTYYVPDSTPKGPDWRDGPKWPPLGSLSLAGDSALSESHCPVVRVLPKLT